MLRPGVGWLALGCATFLASATSSAADPPATTKILLLGHDKDGHPRATHEYLPASELLAKCLRQTPGVEAVVSNRWPRDPALAADARAIVLYVPWGANVLFDGPQRQAAETLLDQGAGLVALHWSTGAVGPEFGRQWLRRLGGWFHTDFSPIEHVERTLHQALPQHPICRGWSDFTIFDEFYFDLKFADEAQPLITTEHLGQPQTLAWVLDVPGMPTRRAFGFVGGHYHKNLGDRSFRQAVVNAAIWAAGLEVPPGGSPCELEAVDLELPPDKPAVPPVKASSRWNPEPAGAVPHGSRLPRPRAVVSDSRAYPFVRRADFARGTLPNPAARWVG